MGIVLISSDDAMSRSIPPINPHLVDVNPCRYCICVQPSGKCDDIRRAGFEVYTSEKGISCGDGERVYRDSDNDPAIIRYVEID